jgi:cytoskeletal protein CcmA (bactofilin family)
MDPDAGSSGAPGLGPNEVAVGGAQASVQPSIVGPTLILKGELSVGEALVIHGQVHGSVIGTDSVVIKRGARVSGQISAAQIQFERGTPLDEVVLSGSIRRTAGD